MEQLSTTITVSPLSLEIFHHTTQQNVSPWDTTTFDSSNYCTLSRVKIGPNVFNIPLTKGVG